MAHDIFLQLDGIEGESHDDDHKGWIRLLTFNHSIAQPLAGSVSAQGAFTAGRAAHGDFVALKQIDRATPRLAFFCCLGKTLKTAKFEMCDSAISRRKILEITFHNVLIAAVRPSLSTIMATGEEATAREEIALRYTQIDWSYTMLDPTSGEPVGTVNYYWNVEQNRGG